MEEADGERLLVQDWVYVVQTHLRTYTPGLSGIAAEMWVLLMRGNLSSVSTCG